MIAALYVRADGPYSELPDVDLWDEARDARFYEGPWRVVAHPPCKRWGRYWHGGPSAKVRRVKGDDGGCFAAALSSVRQWGGVLEHPEASWAWPHFGLNTPPRHGGWVAADFQGGWTCCVEQGHYGHRARKATWLYANAGLGVGPIVLPTLILGVLRRARSPGCGLSDRRQASGRQGEGRARGPPDGTGAGAHADAVRRAAGQPCSGTKLTTAAAFAGLRPFVR